MLKRYDWVMTPAFYEQEKALLTLESISADVRISHDAKKNLEELEHAWNHEGIPDGRGNLSRAERN